MYTETPTIVAAALSNGTTVNLPKVNQYLPQQKAAIDQDSFKEFISTEHAAVEIAKGISQKYQQILSDAVERSGLQSYLLEQGAALTIIGGSARGTSSVHSDWDAAILTQEDVDGFHHPAFTEFSDLKYQGIDIKFGLRSLADLGRFFHGPKGVDVESFSALFTIKTLCGDPNLVEAFNTYRNALITTHFPVLFDAFERSIQKRENSSGSLFKLAEFNLKDARGGLRDLDLLSFLDQACSVAGVSSGLDQHDRNTLESAREVLIRAKHALHFSFKGKNHETINIWDNLRREHLLRLFIGNSEPSISQNAAYDMIYTSAQQVNSMLNRVLDHVAEQLREKQLLSPSYQRHSPTLSYCVIQPSALGELFNSRKPVSDTIGQLYENGNLSRVLPEFRYAGFYVDKAGFHSFPLGEHHVRALAEVERLMGRGSRAAISEFEITNPQDRAPLLLATLLHDIAKPDEGQNGDHALLGAARVRDVALRIGFSEEQAQKTALLVRDHMLIADVAGLSKFNLITKEVISRIPNLEYLQELLILTLADKKESNPAAWTTRRRDSLLGAYQQLRIAFGDPQEYQNNLSNLVVQLLEQKEVKTDPKSVKSYLNSIAPHILGFYSPATLAEKVSLINQVKNRGQSDEPPFVAKIDLSSLHENKLNIFFVAPDSDGLLARVSAFLTRKGMLLSSALVDTHNGLACDFLSVQSKFEVKFYDGDQERFASGLRRAVLGLETQPTNSYSVYARNSSQALADSELMPTLSIDLRYEKADNRVSLILSDRMGRDVFPIITPVLTHNHLNVVNAQIGCGNRGIRHYFELHSLPYDEIDITALKSEIEDAFAQSK